MTDRERSGRYGDPVSDAQPADSAEASARTVVIAVLANVLVTLAKAVAAILTGSAALVAETAHSVADTANEVLLYVGVRRGGKPADDQHPLGYGQARYFWSLLSAVGIFVIGGVFAIFEGIRSLLHPEPLTDVPVGIAVILISAVLEAISWRAARRELRAEADSRHLSLGEHIATSANPTPSTVFFEDTAALIGLALALVALILHAMTGSAVPDAIASLLIGVLLIVLSILLARRSAALLIDESAPAAVRDRLRSLVAQQPWVAEVVDLVAVRIGPLQLLVMAEVVPRPGSDADTLVADIARLREELLALPIVTRVEITPC
jgi:cation diffusion facilitator family transporter